MRCDYSRAMVSVLLQSERMACALLPLLPDFSSLARAQATFWADERKGRLMVARRMYALRLGEVLPHRDIAVLRGIEGARMKETYRIAAERARISWSGRRYDRQNPNAADPPNQALNHAASAVEGAAAIAVAATATIPQLGFIHEDSGQSFVLDVADLVRDTVTIPCAFKAAAIAEDAMTDYDKLWFPRPRGDGPLLVSLPQTVQPVSPPARGWSLDITGSCPTAPGCDAPDGGRVR